MTEGDEHSRGGERFSKWKNHSAALSGTECLTYSLASGGRVLSRAALI